MPKYANHSFGSGGGKADNEPFENKKDSVPKEHLGLKHGTLGLAPDSEDGSLPPPDWQNANTQEGTPRVCTCDNTRGWLGCSWGESRQTKQLVSRKDVKCAFARSGRCFLLTLGIRATMEEKKNYGCGLVWLGAMNSITSPRQVKNQTNKGIRGSLNRIRMVYVATSSITSPRQVNRPTNYAMSSELHRVE